jgi:hypothetical protein
VWGWDDPEAWPHRFDLAIRVLCEHGVPNTGLCQKFNYREKQIEIGIPWHTERTYYHTSFGELCVVILWFLRENSKSSSSCWWQRKETCLLLEFKSTSLPPPPLETLLLPYHITDFAFRPLPCPRNGYNWLSTSMGPAFMDSVKHRWNVS